MHLSTFLFLVQGVSLFFCPRLDVNLSLVTGGLALMDWQYLRSSMTIISFLAFAFVIISTFYFLLMSPVLHTKKQNVSKIKSWLNRVLSVFSFSASEPRYSHFVTQNVDLEKNFSQGTYLRIIKEDWCGQNISYPHILVKIVSSRIGRTTLTQL